MTRQIRVDQIDDVFRDAVQQLVKKTTLRWTELSLKATPVGETGNLRNGWKTKVDKYRGTIINNIEYDEPVIFGTSLPLVGEVDLEQVQKIIQLKVFLYYKQSNLQ